MIVAAGGSVSREGQETLNQDGTIRSIDRAGTGLRGNVRQPTDVIVGL